MKNSSTNRSRRTQPGAKGFSLIELLIVVAIILIIAAIAIPNLLRAKIAANESSAAASLRKMSIAEFVYNSTYPTIGYSPDLPSLGGPTLNCTPTPAQACLLDSVLTSGSKSGYLFSATGISLAGPNSTFVVGAVPQSYNQSGVRDFCIATDGVIRINPGSPGATNPVDVPTCTAFIVAQ
jgi:type IV pilus assembly protein PilA